MQLRVENQKLKAQACLQMISDMYNTIRPYINVKEALISYYNIPN